MTDTQKLEDLTYQWERRLIVHACYNCISWTKRGNSCSGKCTSGESPMKGKEMFKDDSCEKWQKV
jgi:hypothetical protein